MSLCDVLCLLSLLAMFLVNFFFGLFHIAFYLIFWSAIMDFFLILYSSGWLRCKMGKKRFMTVIFCGNLFSAHRSSNQLNGHWINNSLFQPVNCVYVRCFPEVEHQSRRFNEFFVFWRFSNCWFLPHFILASSQCYACVLSQVPLSSASPLHYNEPLTLIDVGCCRYECESEHEEGVFCVSAADEQVRKRADEWEDHHIHTAQSWVKFKSQIPDITKV